MDFPIHEFLSITYSYILRHSDYEATKFKKIFDDALEGTLPQESAPDQVLSASDIKPSFGAKPVVGIDKSQINFAEWDSFTAMLNQGSTAGIYDSQQGTPESEALADSVYQDESPQEPEQPSGI
jgi:hypothetical protein